MTRPLHAVAFALCFLIALTADSWVDKPLVALVGIGVAAGLIWAQNEREGKKKTAPDVTSIKSGATSKASH